MCQLERNPRSITRLDSFVEVDIQGDPDAPEGFEMHQSETYILVPNNLGSSSHSIFPRHIGLKTRPELA